MPLGQKDRHTAASKGGIVGGRYIERLGEKGLAHSQDAPD